MLASVWATWLMFGDIPIRQLGLWVGPCICSDKNTLLISVSQLWYLCLFSFKYVLSCSVMSDSVTTWTIACFSVHGDSPGKNTRVGCHALLQGIFLTQGSNPGLLHCKWILYCLSHQGSPIWVYWFLKPNLFHTCHRSNCLESSVWETASGVWDSDGVKHTHTHTLLRLWGKQYKKNKGDTPGWGSQFQIKSRPGVVKLWPLDQIQLPLYL